MFRTNSLCNVTILPGFHEIENLELRVPFVPILDFSSSMTPFIPKLPKAWSHMVQALARRSLSRLRIELACCVFHSHVVYQDFAPLPFYIEKPMTFEGSGMTALGTALKTVLQQTRQRRQVLAEHGIECCRAICPVISDGEATDSNVLAEVIPEIRLAEEERILDFVPITPDSRNTAYLRHIFAKQPIPLDVIDFDLLFRALARSLSEFSQSQPGLEVDGRPLLDAHLKALPRVD